MDPILAPIPSPTAPPPFVPTVLLVGKSGTSCYYLSELVRQWGCEVTVSLDGAEAWELIQERSYSFVVADWDLPGISGFSLLQKIRGAELGRYVYVILLSDGGHSGRVLEGMRAGGDDIMIRPFGEEELRVRIRAGERILQLQKELLARNGQLAKANARMHRHLEAAGKVQRSLVPADFPPLAGFEFAWKFRPCSYAAGDMLNVVRLDENTVGLFVLDVSGHGVASAMLSVIVSHVLSLSHGPSSLVKRRLTDPPHYEIVSPGDVVQALRERFPHDERNPLYFTLLYGVLDVRDSTLRWVSAGHPSPVLVRDGKASDLSGSVGSIPLGLPIPCSEDPVNSLVLNPGDRLCFFSDGIIEAADPADEWFDAKGVAASLARSRGLPLDRALDVLLTEASAWIGGGGFDDDVTLLALEYDPAG